VQKLWDRVLSCKTALLEAEVALLECTGWKRADGGWKHPVWTVSALSHEVAVRETSIRIRSQPGKKE
jgi:hypothetical protein